ncbi:MAG: glucosylglycerol 3-phosphatase [Cyanobacteria bacterium J06631_9]
MLSSQTLSLNHAALSDWFVESKNILIIQDLDGVCMPLVNDPLTRKISPAYLRAAAQLNGHFFVLTNGEHVGQRGLQTIIERALSGADDADAHTDAYTDSHIVSKRVAEEGLYLPGLAAGGVQWQDRKGVVSHPGVGQAELDFLAKVPGRIEKMLSDFLAVHCGDWSAEEREQAVQASVLDNVASPTANLNSLHALFVEKAGTDMTVFVQLQAQMAQLMETLLTEAEAQGLADQFFVHYAPNLGRDGFVHEVIWLADGQTAGTTDFQFMLRGAVKEAGVLALLNHYFFEQTGHYPLGVDFNARQAPRSLEDMLALVMQNFDPALMPRLMGVGDTVTSQGDESGPGLTFRRGGSDRGFLQLIQNIGNATNTPALTVYVDSSGGELSNRRSLTVEKNVQGHDVVIGGIGDPRDTSDPLQVNVAFPGGPQQYCAWFEAAAAAYAAH